MNELKDFLEGKTLQEAVLAAKNVRFLIRIFVHLYKPKKYSDRHIQLLKATNLLTRYAYENMPKTSLESLEVFERFASGNATEEEFDRAANLAAIYSYDDIVKMWQHSSAYYEFSTEASLYAYYSDDIYCFSHVLFQRHKTSDTTHTNSLDISSEMSDKIRPILFPEYKTNEQ